MKGGQRGPGEAADPGVPPGILARGVIVAAGASTRMAGVGGARKPLIELAGRPLLAHTLEAFERAARIGAVVVLAHAEDLEAVRDLAAQLPANKVRAVLPGGAERCDSVRIGVSHELTQDTTSLVCIHDGARPLVTPELVDRVVERAAATGAALLALPVRDTLKHAAGEGVDRTVDRSELWSAQTPQVFERARFSECLREAERGGESPTDDAALWERSVGPVAIVRGDPANLKVTEPDDLALAQAILAWRGSTTSGAGGEA